MRARPADAPCGAKHRASGPVPPEVFGMYYIEAANKLVGNSPASDGEYFEIARELEERGLRELSILAKFKRVSMQRAK